MYNERGTDSTSAKFIRTFFERNPIEVDLSNDRADRAGGLVETAVFWENSFFLKGKFTVS